MPKTRKQKEQTLNALKQKIQDSNSVVVSVFDKLTVNDDQKLRHDLRAENLNYEVIKKTLLKKALAEHKIKGMPEEIFGNISVASSQDEVLAAKILSKFSEGKEYFKIIGGILNKIWVGPDKILELAKLPSKNELFAKIIWVIKSPLSGFANVLTGNATALVNVLNNVKDKK